jgi:hypothetical protein
MQDEMRFAARLTGAAALLLTHVLVRHRSSGADLPCLVSARAAAAAPAVFAALATRHAPVRAVPPSAAGKLMLATYLGSGALVEELTWRAPLVWPAPRRVRGCIMAGGVVGFIALHVERDGARSATVHLANTLAWTAAAARGGQMRWPVAGHFVYNWIAVTRRASP